MSHNIFYQTNIIVENQALGMSSYHSSSDFG